MGVCKKMIQKFGKWFGRVCISFSIFVNTLFGGKNNQTVSARQYFCQLQNRWNFCFLINGFFWWEENHCQDSYDKWEVINNAMQYYEEYKEKYADRMDSMMMEKSTKKSEETGKEPLDDYYRLMSQ